MFYRVDYHLALLLAGFLIGVLFSRATKDIAARRLARAYYVAVAIVAVASVLIFAVTVLAPQAHIWILAYKVASDLGNALFGVLFGLAVRRQYCRELLTNPTIVAALLMSRAFSFGISSIGKAFSLAPMTQFFNQSGYSTGFLEFIMMAEAFGAIGLLLPWAVRPALIGLTIDMFGAIMTHVFNGDPVNDSTGAIGQLIRLIAIGILLTMRPPEDARAASRSLRRSVLAVGAVAAVCLLAAAGGGVAIHHLSPAPATVQAVKS